MAWFYLYSLPTVSTTATYAIDGQSPITFNLNGASSEGTCAQYNQKKFQTDQLFFSSHILDVVYQENSATTLLTLSVLVQNNASSHSPSTNGTSNASFDTTNGPRNLGSIIGGVIGGLGLFIFAVLAIIFLR